MDPNQQPNQQQTPQQPGQPMQPVQKKGANTLAVVSIIMAFVIPIVGFITSLIAMSQIKKTGEQGKGLAIAGLVISILSMLSFVAFMVLVVFSASNSVSIKANDIERQADLNIIQAQLEVFYNINGTYPATISSDNLPLAGAQAFIDPDGDEINSTKSDYGYTPSACSAAGCQSYVLSTTLVYDDTTYSKSSLN